MTTDIIPRVNVSGTIILGNNTGNAGTIAAFQFTSPWVVSGNPVATTNSGTCINYDVSSSTILASNVARNYGLIRNYSPQIVYLGYGRSPSTINFDMFLLQYESYEINSSKLFTGNIQAIGDGAGTITVLEY